MAKGVNTTGNSKAIKAQQRRDDAWNNYYPLLKAEFAKQGITINPEIRLLIDYGVDKKEKNLGTSIYGQKKDGTFATPPNIFAENWMNPEYRSAVANEAIRKWGYKWETENWSTGSSAREQMMAQAMSYIERIAKEAQYYGVDYNTLVTSVNQGATDHKNMIASLPAPEGSWMDSFWSVAEPAMNIGLAIATGGLSLPEQLAINAVAALAQGASPEDVLRNSIATLAASEVPGFLDKVGANVSNANVQAVIDNVAKQVTAAAIKGQDIKSAALGGLAGGAVAQGISTSGQLGSYNDQIARAAGEYVQAKTAGLSEEQALTKALTGFVSQSEREKAREQVLQRAESGTYIDPSQPTPQPGTSEFQDMQEKSLPTVEVVDRFQPTAADKLSLTDQGKQAQVGEKNKNLDPRYRVLLSLLNQPSATSQFTGGTSGGKASSVATTGQGASPGSSALAQALRTDSGDTITGSKGGRRAGWNIESLRYMGNTGGKYDKETS